MSQPIRKNVRITKSPDFPAEVRRWREAGECSERDNRPGFYSITGAFVELPERGETSGDDAAK